MDYGDGAGVQALALNQDQTFTLAHTYADEGLYTVTIAVTDGLGSVGQGTFTTTVQNVARLPRREKHPTPFRAA